MSRVAVAYSLKGFRSSTAAIELSLGLLFRWFQNLPRPHSITSIQSIEVYGRKSVVTPIAWSKVQASRPKTQHFLLTGAFGLEHCTPNVSSRWAQSGRKTPTCRFCAPEELAWLHWWVNYQFLECVCYQSCDLGARSDQYMLVSLRQPLSLHASYRWGWLWCTLYRGGGPRTHPLSFHQDSLADSFMSEVLTASS